MGDCVVRKYAFALNGSLQQASNEPSKTKEQKNNDGYRLASVALTNAARSAVRSIVAQPKKLICTPKVTLAAVRAQRAKFTKSGSGIHTWGQMLLKMCGQQQRAEAAAGVKVLRKIMSTNVKAAGPGKPTMTALMNVLVPRSMALNWYAMIAGRGLLTQTELLQGAKAACNAFTYKGFGKSSIVLDALKVLEAVWSQTTNRNAIFYSADLVINGYFKFSNSIIVEKAMILFVNTMARHVPVSTLSKALRIMRDVQKNGITYHHAPSGTNATFKASNIDAVLKIAIPVLQKLITAKQRP